MGDVITFYSYKGGTGRSMALANLAWILASNDKRVLVIDWDLEAPGLHRYFRPFLPDKELTAHSSRGLIDFVRDYAIEAATPHEAQERTPSWYASRANILRYASSVTWDFGKRGTIDFVPAGRQGPTYASFVNSFNWVNFYERLGGGLFLRAARDRMKEDYDYVLIDSRTGVTDTAGICTVVMPDVLVVCFTLNNQSIEGATGIAYSVAEQSRDGSDRPPVRILPMPTRTDPFEKKKLERRRRYARARFARFVSDRAYWADVEMPYVPYYSYEETLAPFEDEPGDLTSVLACCERLARHVTRGTVTRLVPPTDAQRAAVLSAFEEVAEADLEPDRPMTLRRARVWSGVLALVASVLLVAGLGWGVRQIAYAVRTSRSAALVAQALRADDPSLAALLIGEAGRFAEPPGGEQAIERVFDGGVPLAVIPLGDPASTPRANSTLAADGVRVLDSVITGGASYFSLISTWNAVNGKRSSSIAVDGGAAWFDDALSRGLVVNIDGRPTQLLDMPSGDLVTLEGIPFSENTAFHAVHFGSDRVLVADPRGVWQFDASPRPGGVAPSHAGRLILRFSAPPLSVGIASDGQAALVCVGPDSKRPACSLVDLSRTVTGTADAGRSIGSVQGVWVLGSRYLLFGETDTRVIVVDRVSGRRVNAFSVAAGGETLAIAPGDRSIAVGHEESIRLYSLPDGAPGRTLRLKTGATAQEVQFAGNGRRLLGVTGDSLVIWDLSAKLAGDSWRARSEALRRLTTRCLTAGERETYLRESPEEARSTSFTCEAAYGRPSQEQELALGPAREWTQATSSSRGQGSSTTGTLATSVASGIRDVGTGVSLQPEPVATAPCDCAHFTRTWQTATTTTDRAELQLATTVPKLTAQSAQSPVALQVDLLRAGQVVGAMVFTRGRVVRAEPEPVSPGFIERTLSPGQRRERELKRGYELSRGDQAPSPTCFPTSDTRLLPEGDFTFPLSMLGDGRTFDSVRVHLYALMCGREKPVIGLNRARLLF